LHASLSTNNAAATLRGGQFKLIVDMKYRPNLRSQLLSLDNTCTLDTLSMVCQRAKQQSIQGVGMSAADTDLHMYYITIGCCHCLGEGLVKI